MKQTQDILIVGLLIASVVAGCDAPPAPENQVRPVRAVKIGDATEFERRWFPGRAAAVAEAELSFRVSGPLISLAVDVGDKVQKGHLLASIDPQDFQTALASVTANLEQSRANLLAMKRGARPEEIAVLRAKLAKSEATYKLAVVENERIEKLLERKAASQYEFDQSLARREESGAEVKKAEEDLRIGLVGARKEDIEAKEAEIRSLQASVIDAGNQLDYAKMLSPFDGTIVARYAENFENVQAKQPILRLVNTEKIELTVQIPEKLMPLAPYVKSVTFRFDAFPGKELKGVVTKIGTEASQTTRTFPITGQFDQPEDFEILPGMAGSARAGVMEKPNNEDESGVVVPLGAVFSPDTMKESFVWVIDESSKTVSRRSVKTGLLQTGGITVIEGLQSGEWIATAGVHSLHDGQKVTILQDDSG